MTKSEPKTRTRNKTDASLALDFAVESARLLADDKCDDVVVLDVRGVSQVSDFLVIGTGTSERQMRSTLGHLEDLGAAQGFKAFRTSDDERSTWLLTDFVDVVVHLFEPNTRAHYDLEMLWGDATRIPWERPVATKSKAKPESAKPAAKTVAKPVAKPAAKPAGRSAHR